MLKLLRSYAGEAAWQIFPHYSTRRDRNPFPNSRLTEIALLKRGLIGYESPQSGRIHISVKGQLLLNELMGQSWPPK